MNDRKKNASLSQPMSFSAITSLWKIVMFACEWFIPLLKNPVHHGDNCSFDGLTSSAGVHRSIENFYWAGCQQCEETQHGNWHRRSNFKISQKQRSRLEGVELDKPVSSIYSTPSEALDVQSVVALGQQTLTSKESLHTGDGSISSSDACCPLIPLYLHTCLFS